MSNTEEIKSHANKASIGESMEVCTPTNSTSIVNNNHPNEKSQSKSSASSPKSNHSIDVKRVNKEHVQSEAIESIDVENFQPSSNGVGKDWQGINGWSALRNVSFKADAVVTHMSSNERRNFFTHKTLSPRVCDKWNLIIMKNSLGQTVRLNDSTVCDWNKCIDVIHDQGLVLLDMRRMVIPTEIETFNTFWWEFQKAIKKAHKLRYLELYKCPASIVESTISSLPQLRVLNAISVTNRPNLSEEMKNANQLMTLNLRYLDQMTNLAEIKIKGRIGIKLTCLPSFETLVNLKSLSLISIIAFPKNTCRAFETLSTNLKFFEIGDCDCLSEDFADVLKRLTNLTFLRLVNCSGRFKNFAKKVLSSIRGLDKLKILELINIKFSNDVEYELEKCTNIKGLLIIPLYDMHCAATNCRLIDCLKKLKNTLSHLVWGITEEMIRCTDFLITLYQPNQHAISYDLGSSGVRRAGNNIPILRTRKPRQTSGEESVDDEVHVIANIDILSVPDLEKFLKILMVNGKTKVVRVPFATTPGVYLLEHFNDIKKI